MVSHQSACRRVVRRAEQLDENMRAIIARMQSIDAELGTLLSRMADARLHRRLGYGDLGAYCRNELGLGTRKVRALIAIERRRRRSGSRLNAAYRSGEEMVSAFSRNQKVIRALAGHDFGMTQKVGAAVLTGVRWGAA